MLIYKLDIILRANVGKYAVFARVGAGGEIIANIVFVLIARNLRKTNYGIIENLRERIGLRSNALISQIVEKYIFWGCEDGFSFDR